ncbi:unnamed protein product [Paramecium sonneborni]|uniref:Uncharacterized protein n=1 Tax=Paramecium sonneborni TaxID=65129 RepID=A0A8S1PXD7_9CILI|nr:unnamed protein product [Paramecium sonneborni]
MIKRLIPLSKQIRFAIQNSSKILQIQKVQFPSQMKLYKISYNFSKNQKISLVEGIQHIQSLQRQVVAINDLEKMFENQLQIVKYLEDNLQNFDDLYFTAFYIEQMIGLYWYQVAIYAYQKQENLLNSDLTSKLMNLELMKELDIIKENQVKKPKDIENLSIQLKAASIMCYMITYGVNAEIDQLHDWMNDYLDQIELNNQLNQEESSIQNMFSKGYSKFKALNDQLIHFYFFIAQIHKQRNLIEEFQRFQHQGIEEAKSFADRSLLENKSTFSMELILINFFELFSNLRIQQDVSEEIILDYAKKVIEFGSKFWKDSKESYIQDIKVGFAQYFMSQELFENAAVLLEEVYKNKSAIDSDNTDFLLYSNIYFCQKQGFLKEIDFKQVLIEADDLNWIDLDFLLIQVLDFNLCVFDDALETKDLKIIEFRFQKVIYYIHELSKLIQKDQYKAMLPIFNWIDSVLTDDFLNNNTQFILSIYNALNLFKDIKLDIDRQNLEKDFYLIILSFKLDKQLKLDINQQVKNVENFVTKYSSNREMQIITIEKVLLFNFQLMEQDKLEECLRIIDSVISILQKGNKNLQRYVQQFLNQKNQAQRKKKHQ